MHINFTPWMILWAALALAVLVMAGYRKIVSVREDETLHLVNPSESASGGNFSQARAHR